MSTTVASATWKTRWIFILAATGSAVGLGNIWKFPYITGEYGGGAFVLVYLACILLIGIPVMIAEVMLGRAARTNPLDAIRNQAKEANRSAYWSIIGAMGMISGMLILMFYSVVAGWVMDYLYQSLSGSYAEASPEAISDSFGALYNDPARQMVWHSLFCVITAFVVAGGVQRGIGRAVEILMPLLFIMMLILLGYSIAEGDFETGFQFMFAPDFSKLSADAVLEAMGHSFFTLSLGMGSIMVYGAYMPAHASIGKTILTVGFFDTALAIMAGLIIFPLVFANGMEPSQSVGLMFKTLPITFSQMPFGMVFASIFFTLVTIAALSSSISLLEPSVAWMEKRGIKRSLSTMVLAAVAWTGGLLCLNIHSVFNFLDNLTTKYSMPLCGLLIVFFVGWILPREQVAANFKVQNGWIYECWYWSARVIAPLGILIVIANQFELF